MPIETSGIYCRPLTVKDKNEVIESIANSFCMRNPLLKSLKLSKKERYEYATYAAMFLADNKSSGAFDGDNDEQLCGVQINCSSYFVPDIDLEKYLQSVSPKTQYLIRVMTFVMHLY
ncbi:unnamed protein product [Clavelina lepadiformis]|uniref:Uncharacterized protein n=1 Tax=Clavelina lepadiformis TaxID=159417 RepID=A0ABP0FE89_CLALP